MIIAKIPYSIFLFLWSLLGTIILGFFFVENLIENNKMEIALVSSTSILWFLIFLWYVIKFLKYKMIKK